MFLKSTAKIRWFIFFAAAITLAAALWCRKLDTPQNQLRQQATQLQLTLNHTEANVYALLNQAATWQKLQGINHRKVLALQFFDFASQNQLGIYCYTNQHLTYWTGNGYQPESPASIALGTHFIKQARGCYISIKKSAGQFSVICLIPIKRAYYSNNYNTVKPLNNGLLSNTYLDTANTIQPQTTIYSVAHQPLFKVCINKSNSPAQSNFIIGIWLLAGLLAACCINQQAHKFAQNGKLLLAVFLLLTFISGLRYLNLFAAWPNLMAGNNWFSPTLYYGDRYNPSLADTAINFLLITWLLAFVYQYRQKLQLSRKHKVWGIAYVVLATLLLVALSYGLREFFAHLIIRSAINFDVSNILNLSAYSLLGVLLFCLACLCFILLTEILLNIGRNLPPGNNAKLGLFFGIMGVISIISALRGNYSGFYALLAFVVAIRADAVYTRQGKYNALMLISLIIICSAMASSNLYWFQKSKELQCRMQLARTLAADTALIKTSQQLNSNGATTELLIDEQLPQNNDYSNYSCAFYANNVLVYQTGSFIYNVNNTLFKSSPGHFTQLSTVDGGMGFNSSTYHHLVYQPNAHNLLVLSRPDDRLFKAAASVTFFFLILLAFTLLVLAAIYTNRQAKRLWQTRQWPLLRLDRLKYKTRIQLTMVLAVVFTLLIIGLLTFLSVSKQFQNQQDDYIRTKLSHVTASFEKKFVASNLLADSSQAATAFSNFAENYLTDITFYNASGNLQLTTQPGLYKNGLLVPLISSRAFTYLSGLQQSVFLNDEHVNNLNYKAAYAPVKNRQGVIVGYLQLPYFANQTEYRQRIGAFLNTMINVYALVFVAIGLFAIAVARQITTPLTLIQQSLSKTRYGLPNQPIEWTHTDEIGALISEYNHMIAQLEESAKKLARVERENAWREMAKQVAHEIKNPLTPLKLGLQLLEKAWKDKDPRFDVKFERFTKSFVEQIDSLSNIASEFSSFAKIPDSQPESFNMVEVLGQAVSIFLHTQGAEVTYMPPSNPFYILADKDQIMRCFNNLIKTAVDSIPTDRHGRVEIVCQVFNTEVLVQIKDNGIGIPENQREHLFSPSFTTKSSVSGMGLALVKNSVEYAGGTISFSSTTGLGTTFYLRFPGSGLPQLT